MEERILKRVFWMGDSQDVLRSFPKEVQEEIGFALYYAQSGGKHSSAKPLKLVGGGVFEIVSDFDRNTYRAVYAVKFASGICVLHVFQKKSRKGISTPKAEIDLIKSRLKRAREDNHARES